MDKCTHEVRKQYWKNIIGQCLQRPEGMTAKQWLDENNICEQTYYHWLKRIRQETYELATTSANTTCMKTMHGEVAFAEVPLPAMDPATSSENGFRPDITILSIPAPVEPPVRSLRATIPVAQSRHSGGENHHSGN